jgi:hypothetical protein
MGVPVWPASAHDHAPARQHLQDLVDAGTVLGDVDMESVEARVVSAGLHEPKLRIGVALIHDARLERSAARNVWRSAGFGDDLQQSLAAEEEVAAQADQRLLRQARLTEQTLYAVRRIV